MTSTFFRTIGVALALNACGATLQETITQRSEAAFIKFIGNVKGASFAADGGKPMMISGDEDATYQLAPGKHELWVFRDRQQLVHRVIVVDNGATTEVDVP